MDQPDHLEDKSDTREDKIEIMANSVTTMLEAIGEDPSREGLQDTPKRYAEAMMFFTKGYTQDLEEVTNGAIFNEDHDELVLVKDIQLFSMCEHHFSSFLRESPRGVSS